LAEIVHRDGSLSLTLRFAISHVIRWFKGLCAIDNKYADRTGDLIYSGFAVSINVPPRFSVTVMNKATHVTRDLNINPTQLTDAGVFRRINHSAIYAMA